ncbi:MAG: TetR/AcrR family transcriptional regulator [Acidimicrobiia bacterium]|nr:TetR/AcrR family transcriptional regulator [Acidimicrobiia bacterium]
MTGLRDRKKREQRHRIIQAAATLFTEHGLDATTMDDIAAAADVSVATVYNYFGSKSALLLAGVEEDAMRIVAAGQAVIDDPGPDVVAATQRLARIYLDDVTTWDRRLLREVLGAAFQRSGGLELTQELARMDQMLIEQMMLLLAGFHAEGSLAEGVEVDEATMLIFSGFVLQLFMFIGFEGLTNSDLYAQVDRQIELAFAGLNRESESE